MKHFKDYITEQQIAVENDTIQEGNNGDEVYVVYFGDGTMYNYFMDYIEKHTKPSAPGTIGAKW